MGQRHQGFIKVNSEDKDFTVAYHHQWLFGAIAMSQTRNILEFDFKASEYYKFGRKNHFGKNELNKVILSLASTNVKSGYYHNVIDLQTELEDWDNAMHPAYQDNNDGQHFIDFTVKGKPKMCFAFPFEKDIYDTEGNNIIDTIPTFKVMGARDYFALYYSQAEIDKATETNNKSDILFFKKALRDIKWIENHTKLMTQEEFEVLYPNLND